MTEVRIHGMKQFRYDLILSWMSASNVSYSVDFRWPAFDGEWRPPTCVFKFDNPEDATAFRLMFEL